MQEVGIEEFELAPVGRWTTAGPCVVWCESETLGGGQVWGRPSADDARAIVRTFEVYPLLALQFDVVFDARGIEGIDLDALEVLVEWLRERRGVLAKRVRMEAGIISAGPHGYLLSGLLPALGESYPFRVFEKPEDAFTAVAGERGPALGAEIDAIAERVRGVPRELRALRTLLASHAGDLSVEKAARELALSSRSLQRVLLKHGTSFRDEVVTARLATARTLLATTDAKVSAIGARLGVSSRALTLMFRAKTGVTPAEFRRQNRDAGARQS